MRERVLKDWNFMRAIKLIVAIYICYQAVDLHEYLLFLLAALFFYQSIWNVSSCAMSGSCEVKPRTKTD
ncbi:MAG: hypothetical protein KJ712_05870 [Bacteroidetes bacterium]|nr:hypothetical protein [Bacteroidota bacterium]MBU1483580.1 hypothetical protein [Bacteroidota bacterium]MBU2046238.1 hypothetical protein [Bacteroidota bacterium]MBU2267983.1 hypothetical protein [Bacteroidota bacterium]MBU2375015.1 hypothetical protein [Bacteroidota bacterium]